MFKYFLIYLLLISFPAFAEDITLPTTYAVNGQVTSTNLNGNFTAITSVVNGGLDNDNADTSGGYRFFETRSSLPSNGTQGRVVFNTADNTLNFDNGSSWLGAVAPSGTLATGKIPVYNSGWALLTPGAQYLPLVSNGVASLPSYQALPIAGGGTGQVTAQAAIDALLPSQASANGKYLTSNGSASSWGALTTGTQIFTTSDTFTAPTGVTKVYLSMSAGGGGGKTSPGGGNGGGGGGAGSFIINYPYTVVPGNNYTVTIGAGGAAGSTGGTTTFDTLSLTGGASGVAATTAGVGAGGFDAATVAAFKGGDGGANGGGSSGKGGATAFGIGGAARVNAGGNQTGVAAAANTGGGGGGGESNSGAGGAGGSGICIVMY